MLALQVTSQIAMQADNVVLGQLPYAIALDWKRQLVVLSCRGTSSIRDAVTDAIGQPIDLALWLSEEGDEVHVSPHSLSCLDCRSMMMTLRRVAPCRPVPVPV